MHCIKIPDIFMTKTSDVNKNWRPEANVLRREPHGQEMECQGQGLTGASKAIKVKLSKHES